MKIRAGVIGGGEVKARGPSLDVVLRDELPGVTWLLTVEAETRSAGIHVVGRVQTLPFVSSGHSARRVAVAHVPGVLRWRIRAESIPTRGTLARAGVLLDGSDGAAAVPGVYAQAELELVSGRACGGPALEAVPGASYLVTGADVVPTGFAQSGILLARPGRVLEVSVANSNTEFAYCLLWLSPAPPPLGTPVGATQCPIIIGGVGSNVRTWARPLVVTSGLCWTASGSPFVRDALGPDLHVCAQVE